MEKFILTTPGELENIIQNAITKAFSEYKVQNPQPEQDKLLTVDEASAFLNLAPQTLYGFTSKNLIPFIKRTRKLYFRKSQLEKWLSEGRNT